MIFYVAANGKVVIIARCLGGVKTPPYRPMILGMQGRTVCAPGVGDSARLRGRTMFAPTAHVWLDVGGGVPDAPFLAPEGSIGRGRKGVKKNAALLHFLAFAFSDHLIGVLRGE